MCRRYLAKKRRRPAVGEPKFAQQPGDRLGVILRSVAAFSNQQPTVNQTIRWQQCFAGEKKM
jgi:hypothetical protein